MTSKAPSNQGGSTSGISDVKYQKAIKEISKLISLNTTLKNDATKLQEKYEKLQIEYDLLENKYNSLKCQSKIDTTIQIIPEVNKIAEKVQSRVFEDSGDFTELLNKNKRITQLQAKLKEKDEKINKLKRELEQKNNEIQDEKNKNQILQHQITNIQSMRNMKISEASEKQNFKLKKELESSEQWIKKISSEYESLKRQCSAGSKIFTNSNSIQFFGQTQNSQDILTLKKSETSNLKLKKQFSRREDKLRTEIQKLRKEKQEHFRKLINLNSFVEKQHVFIEKFITKERTQSVQTF